VWYVVGSLPAVINRRGSVKPLRPEMGQRAPPVIDIEEQPQGCSSPQGLRVCSIPGEQWGEPWPHTHMDK